MASPDPHPVGIEADHLLPQGEKGRTSFSLWDEGGFA